MPMTSRRPVAPLTLLADDPWGSHYVWHLPLMTSQQVYMAVDKATHQAVRLLVRTMRQAASKNL